MRKMLIAALAAAYVSTAAAGVTAWWTGAQEMVTTVTGLVVWKCGYYVGVETVYRLFKDRCPPSIVVE